MSRKKPEGLNALIAVDVPPIEDLTLLDFFAAFATMSGHVSAATAYDLAESMIKERRERMK